MIHQLITHLIHMVNQWVQHVPMFHLVIAHWINMVNHGEERGSMHSPVRTRGWTRLQDVQGVSPGMRPMEVRIASIRAMGKSHGESWGDSMTSMDSFNAFIGNSMRESMTHYFHLRTFPIDSPIPLKTHGDSMR